MAERFTSAGKSNRLSAEGARSQECGFAAELTSNRKVWAGLMVKKLNIVYLFMDAWLSGKSNRLITGRSWVRIPERPLLFLQNKYICERLSVEIEFIIFSSTGSTPKACEARDAAYRSTGK